MRWKIMFTDYEAINLGPTGEPKNKFGWNSFYGVEGGVEVLTFSRYKDALDFIKHELDTREYVRTVIPADDEQITGNDIRNWLIDAFYDNDFDFIYYYTGLLAQDTHQAEEIINDYFNSSRFDQDVLNGGNGVKKTWTTVLNLT